MIYANEIDKSSQLHPIMQMAIFNAAVAAEQGHEVWVCLTAPKVTDTPPRQGNGQDYLTLPGVSSATQIGTLSVHRYVDNAENRRLDRVDDLYFKVKSITRANGMRPYGWTNVRPSQITGFMQLGVVSPRPETEMPTRALAESVERVNCICAGRGDVCGGVCKPLEA